MRTQILAAAISRTSLLLGSLCLSGALVGGSAGCSETSVSVPPKGAPRPARPYVKPAQQNADTPTVENTEERGEEIRRVCTRKAQTSPDLPRCWQEEAERSGNKKLEASIRVMLYVNGQGSAQDVSVLGSVPALSQMEGCVVEAVKSWSYPTGQTVVPVQCNFLLRSSQ